MKKLILLVAVAALMAGCRSSGYKTEYHQNLSNQPSGLGEPGSPPVSPSPLNNTPPP